MTARPIMVQGTMSNVGKSLLVAGLCRVLAQDGLKAVPFKAQNMALNSCVTAEGLEMGRAQVMQAEAAGVEPVAAMNPVLLKPTNAVGSQVIIRGKPVGTMTAREYFRYRPSLRGTVRGAYDSLAEDADVVVIEGAGSPAEINLGRDEFVNMGMAHMVGAPVLLAGDIDPGGVFAQLAGTLDLLEPRDRALVKGLVINKFRGDASLLAPGLASFGDRMGVPVIGVVPYLSLDLDDEDSLAPRLAQRGHGACLLDVAVVRLPHLSNFTDMGELERHPLVGVRYVDAVRDVGWPDLLIVPGTKNTMADTAWLKDSGMASCVAALAVRNVPVLGICGGYQLLGQELDDAGGAEGGSPSRARGLGLLPVKTTFGTEKRLSRTRATVCTPTGFWSCLDGRALDGYEIHAGATKVGDGAEGGVDLVDGGRIGCAAGSVLGTYLHGLFDAPGVVDGLVEALLRARGLSGMAAKMEPRATYRARQYDTLAAALRDALDMDELRCIIRRGI